MCDHEHLHDRRKTAWQVLSSDELNSHPYLRFRRDRCALPDERTIGITEQPENSSETPDQAAIRELLEQTGYTPQKILFNLITRVVTRP